MYCANHAAKRPLSSVPVKRLERLEDATSPKRGRYAGRRREPGASKRRPRSPCHSRSMRPPFFRFSLAFFSRSHSKAAWQHFDRGSLARHRQLASSGGRSASINVMEQLSASLNQVRLINYIAVPKTSSFPTTWPQPAPGRPRRRAGRGHPWDAARGRGFKGRCTPDPSGEELRKSCVRVCERAGGELRDEAACTGRDLAPRISQREELASGAKQSSA